MDFQYWKLNILLPKALTSLQSVFDLGVVINVVKVDASLLVEQNVGMVGDDLMHLMLGQLDDLMVVELVPITFIFHQ